MTEKWSLLFVPLVPWPLVGVGILLACAMAIAAFRSQARRGLGARTLLAFLLLALLAGPTLTRQEREALPATILLVRDESASMAIDGRDKIRDKAAAALQTRIEALGPQFKLATVSVTGDEETDLYRTMANAALAIPPGQRAGVILLTDGQIHDLPRDMTAIPDFGPVHALITGAPDQPDRKLELVKAPAYGMIGGTAKVSLRVSSPTEQAGAPVDITVTDESGEAKKLTAHVGEAFELDFPVNHAGENHLEVEAASLPHELTTRNNALVLTVSGVRDRLRVLLVSAMPNMGLRVWRDMLKADPTVDLVNFTILRTRAKIDPTPPDQMALIEFPVTELFQDKLGKFDLVIFDGFAGSGLIPESYLENIAHYVEAGGALLQVGDGMPSPGQILPGLLDTAGQPDHPSPLARLLPVRPRGPEVTDPFRPQLTDKALRHPVTRGLDPNWGQWLALEPGEAGGGDVLLESPDHTPLLVLAAAGKGRVAQIATDQMWLWARGYDGGGPEADLIRRVVHWLLRDPTLEGEYLSAKSEGDHMLIRRQTLDPGKTFVSLTGPDGMTAHLELPPASAGISELEAGPYAPGLYRLAAGPLTTDVMLGPAMDVPEWRDVQATDARLKPLVLATGGGAFWVAAGEDAPQAYATADANRYHDGRALGFRKSSAWHVLGVSDQPLVPPLPALAVLALVMGAGWWRESRRAD